nr:MAG TPA: hypothetical protein [Caudoviricetes sp.]
MKSREDIHLYIHRRSSSLRKPKVHWNKWIAW